MFLTILVQDNKNDIYFKNIIIGFTSVEVIFIWKKHTFFPLFTYSFLIVYISTDFLGYYVSTKPEDVKFR